MKQLEKTKENYKEKKTLIVYNQNYLQRIFPSLPEITKESVRQYLKALTKKKLRYTTHEDKHITHNPIFTQ